MKLGEGVLQEVEVSIVPVLSMFFGIIVRMYREQGGKHHMPHIHVEYSGMELVVGTGMAPSLKETASSPRTS